MALLHGADTPCSSGWKRYGPKLYVKLQFDPWQLRFESRNASSLVNGPGLCTRTGAVCTGAQAVFWYQGCRESS